MPHRSESNSKLKSVCFVHCIHNKEQAKLYLRGEHNEQMLSYDYVLTHTEHACTQLVKHQSVQDILHSYKQKDSCCIYVVQ